MYNQSVENIVLFVGDAVRFDEAADRLSALGPTYRSIAASLHTPASFGSLLTGLDVPGHGITGFDNVLPEGVPSLLDTPGFDTAFSHKTGTMHEDMHRIFRTPAASPLAEMEPPFIWVVRDPGGHAPYAGYDGDTYEQISETGGEYFRRRAGDADVMARDYSHAVDDSIDRFEAARRTIRERGLEDETLFVYTSDHGELLGEYGLLGHNHIACPELVYVPTTFVHPTLESGREREVIRHVDLVPTLYDALGRDPPGDPDGTSLFEPADRVGHNHFEMNFYNTPGFDDVSNVVRSCWDESGGHVFVENDLQDSLAVYLGLLLSSHNGRHMLRTGTVTAPLRKLLPGHERYGRPEISQRSARKRLHADRDRNVETAATDLDEETKARLDDLGYV